MPDLFTTRGIVFHHIKYGETSIIARIYTEKFGLQSYIVKGVRSKRARIKPNLFQPGTLLDMVVYNSDKHSLQHIREVRCEHLYESVVQDVRKSSILLFLIEILYKAIREEEPNQPLFDFIHGSLLALDKTTGSVAGFHLVFLILLSRFLGFFPRENYSEKTAFFNLAEGEFQSGMLLPGYYIKPPLSRTFSHLLYTGYTDMDSFTLPPSSRNELLEKILIYYSLHSPFVKDIKSHLVLREVFA